MRKKKILRSETGRGLSLVALGLCAALSVAGCKAKDTVPANEVEVQSAVAHESAITEHITADAVLAPLAQAAIAPRISAPVVRFNVQRGSKVRAGELLATLENRDLQAAVTDNQGSYDAAQASYQTTTKAQVPEDYQKAELGLAQASANLDLNQNIVNSRKQLFAQGALPGRDLDTAQAALVQARAAFDTAQKHLVSMKEVSRESALKSAKGQLESAKGKYLGAQAQFGYSEVRSPIAGVVTERPLFVGETAAAGTPLLTVMNTSALLAKIHLSQQQAQMLDLGNTAEMHVPGLDDPVKGKITLISPALDPGSTTVEVWVRIENGAGKLRPGTAVKVSLAGKSVAKALVVPSEAIIAGESGKKFVMLIAPDGVAHRQEVETGIADAGETQVLSGISASQQVVTNGAYSLDDGTKVKVVDLPEQGAADKPKAGGNAGETK